jgi:hypothetical protein
MYQRMYMLVQQADSLDAGGQSGPALAKYREAQTLLRTLKSENPRWNADAVSYRLNYLATKIAALAQQAAKPATGGPAPAPREAAPEAKASAPAAASPAKLLDAGAEPRRVLRRHPGPGAKQSVSLTMKLATDVQAGPAPSQSIKLPTIQITLDTTVKSVSPDGEILYDLTVGKADVAAGTDSNPQLTELLKPAFSALKGLSGSGSTSDRGFSKGPQIRTPAGSAPQLGQFIDLLKESLPGLLVPLPEEAVGPGAKWEVKTPIKNQGMAIDQTTTYQLVSVEGDRLTLKDTVEQRASKQKVQIPAMPGLAFDLTRLTGKGSEDLTLDLGALLPREGASSLVWEAAMEMNVAGQKSALTMKTAQDVRIQGE